MPKISVIVPVYKVEKYLNRCVDSILNQTFKDFELILVDDGSPDNSPKMCDEYALKDSRIHVIHKENGGLSSARNAGIEYALKTDSEWIAFIDSDDWVHSQYLETLIYCANKHDAEISCVGFTKLKKFVKQSKYKIEELKIKVDTADRLFVDIDDYDSFNLSVAWARLYKKKLFKNVRYPLGKYHEDEYVTYKVLGVNKKIAVAFVKIYYYFNNSNSIMNSKISAKRISDWLCGLYEKALFYLNNNCACKKETVSSCIFYVNEFSSVSFLGIKKGWIIRKYKKLILKILDEKKYNLPNDYCCDAKKKLEHIHTSFLSKLFFRFKNKIKRIIKKIIKTCLKLV